MLRPFERHENLLPDFIKLAGGLQQIELGLLALEIGVEVSQPPVVLLEPSFLNFANINAALSKLRLKDAQILLSQLQLQAGDFLVVVSLAQTAGLRARGGGVFARLV